MKKPVQHLHHSILRSILSTLMQSTISSRRPRESEMPNRDVRAFARTTTNTRSQYNAPKKRIMNGTLRRSLRADKLLQEGSDVFDLLKKRTTDSMKRTSRRFRYKRHHQVQHLQTKFFMKGSKKTNMGNRTKKERKKERCLVPGSDFALWLISRRSIRVGRREVKSAAFAAGVADETDDAIALS